MLFNNPTTEIGFKGMRPNEKMLAKQTKDTKKKTMEVLGEKKVEKKVVEKKKPGRKKKSKGAEKTPRLASIYSYFVKEKIRLPEVQLLKNTDRFKELAKMWKAQKVSYTEKFHKENDWYEVERQKRLDERKQAKKSKNKKLPKVEEG